MLHLQHTHLPVWGAAGTSHFPVHHIALDATEPGENAVDEYERWSAFLTSFNILNKWSLDVEFHSFDPKKFLQIFILDPINFVRWELNFPVHAND